MKIQGLDFGYKWKLYSFMLVNNIVYLTLLLFLLLYLILICALIDNFWSYILIEYITFIFKYMMHTLFETSYYIKLFDVN